MRDRRTKEKENIKTKTYNIAKISRFLPFLLLSNVRIRTAMRNGQCACQREGHLIGMCGKTSASTYIRESKPLTDRHKARSDSFKKQVSIQKRFRTPVNALYHYYLLFIIIIIIYILHRRKGFRGSSNCCALKVLLIVAIRAVNAVINWLVLCVCCYDALAAVML